MPYRLPAITSMTATASRSSSHGAPPMKITPNNIDFTLDEIKPDYRFNETCQGSVPQAFEAFFESVSFEDAIRNAISIGGDSDTIAAITGSVAEAFYGISDELKEKAESYLDERLLKIYVDFNNKTEVK